MELSVQHLQDRKRPPRLLSSIPNNCTQPHNRCLVEKFPQNIQCTHTCHKTTSQPPSQNECFSEARHSQSSSALGTVSSITNTATAVFPKFLHQPQKDICPHNVHLHHQPNTWEATEEPSSPNVTEATARLRETFLAFSVTHVNS